MTDLKLIDRYNPYGIGIEKMFRLLDDQYDAARATNYPYYNLYKVKKVNEADDQYYIEIAVAGFRQDEIQVSVERCVLEVSAAKKT